MSSNEIASENSSRVACVVALEYAILLTLVLVVAWIGLLVGLIAITIFWAAASRGPMGLRKALLTWLASVLGGSLLCVVMHPVVRAGAAAEVVQCIWNIKVLGVALLNYHQDHGCFPPAYVVDDRGKPMHSWRVLLLPYIGQKALYAQYDFDQPWNEGQNRRLLTQMPTLYGCPSSRPSKGQANYFAVIGPETAWRGAQSASNEQVTDSPAQTILLVEVADSGIPWTRPADLTLEEAVAGSGRQPIERRRISSSHRTELGDLHRPRGPHVLLLDGTVRRLRVPTDSQELAAALAIADGRPFDDSIFEDCPPIDTGKATLVGVTALVAWVVSGVAGLAFARLSDEKRGQEGQEPFS